MELIWIFIQLMIGYNLVLPLILYAVSRMQENNALKLTNKTYDYALIVTAYEDTSHLPAVVNSLLALNYENYLIYVVADNCACSSLEFSCEKVILLRPENVLANNLNSHRYAMQNFKRKHEILTIIDSDNLVEPNYLNEMNVFFNQGYKAVQGVRKPKGLTTPIARLDALRDMYYQFYDGEVLFRLGSSATLSGSGMAFTCNLYTASLRNIDVSGAGFDKALQSEIVRRNRRIAYAPKAIVYDEKTKSSNQLVNQRSRWLNTWFKYFSLGFSLMYIGLKRKWINPLLFGLVLLRPPLFIFISLSILCLFVAIGSTLMGTILWLIAFVAFFFSFFLALREQNLHPKFYRALWRIPTFVFYQLLSLFYMRKANKRSIATKHQMELEPSTLDS